MASGNGAEVVVITGGTAGLGRATVREFARRGARIGILARDPKRLNETVDEVERLGGKAVGIPTDVADPDQVEKAADIVENRLGPIDIWINNAMTSVFAPFREITPAEFLRVTEVTYLGQVYGTMTALKRMLPRDKGAIVQAGSALGVRSKPLQSAYCGAKHAVIGFTDSIRTELIHDKSNVHITVVQLPAMNTPQFDWVKSKLGHKAQPVPPIFEPEVAADAIYWAAHNKRREVYVGGSTVRAIWGQKVIPGLLDRYLGRTGYESQLTEEMETPDRPDNLYKPVSGRYEARGRFDRKAKDTSMETWASLHKKEIGTGLAAVALAAVGFLTARKNGKKLIEALT